MTGLYNSGKSVFLTSLIDQLQNGAGNFTVGSLGSVDFYSGPLQPRKGWKVFPYGCNRKLLGNGVFPEKTTEPHSFTCRVRFAKERRNYLLELLDFPGERFADVAIAGKSYDDWSDEIFLAWRASNPAATEEYVHACRAAKGDATVVVSAFRRFLAAKLSACEPFVTPSSFKLPIKGDMLRGRTIDQMLSNHPVTGVSATQQFAPLEQSERAVQSALTRTMRANYALYRAQVVDPLFSTLRWCDRLIVLVDIPFLLAAGQNALAESDHLLRLILQSVETGTWFTDALKNSLNALLFAAHRLGGIQKIAFVATKLDQVLPQDRPQLFALLRAMVQPRAINLRRVKWECFAVSAVFSTEADESEPEWLNGRLQWMPETSPPLKRSPEDPPLRYSPSRLPQNGWPTRLGPGSYSFPDVYPNISQVAFVPPKHQHLDQVLSFVLSDP